MNLPTQITFCGYKVVHWSVILVSSDIIYTTFRPSNCFIYNRYESVSWIPNVAAFVVMLAVGAKSLSISPAPAPVSAAAILSYSTNVASGIISWATMTPDYGVYHSGEASVYVNVFLTCSPARHNCLHGSLLLASSRIFAYTYLAFLMGSVSCGCQNCGLKTNMFLDHPALSRSCICCVSTICPRLVCRI